MECSRIGGARRRLAASLLVAGILSGGAACADRPPRSDGDSIASVRPVAVAPESAFRARIGVTWELARLGSQDLPPSPARAAAPNPGRHPGPGARPTLRFTDE